MKRYEVKYIMTVGILKRLTIRSKKVSAMSLVDAYYLVNGLDEVIAVLSVEQLTRDEEEIKEVVDY